MGTWKCKVRRLCLVVGLLMNASVECQTVTHVKETALRSSLQSGYDRFVRPYTPTTVYLEYSLRSLSSLDITSQSMSHIGWFTTTWHDPRLVWDSASYSGITVIELNWAWRPEFVITNCVTGLLEIGYDNDHTRVTVFNNGTVRWWPPIIGTTSCDVNIEKFPFDAQSCKLDVTFFGQNYDTSFLLNVTNTQIDTSAYLINGEWEFKGSLLVPNIYTTCCPVSKVMVLEVTISFTRLHPYYIINLLLPAILLSLLMALTFILPTECGERLGFSLTILLSYTVLLTITTGMLPTTSKEVPYIAQYLLIILVLCTMAVGNVSLHVKFYFMESKPTSAIRTMYKVIRAILFLKGCSNKKGILKKRNTVEMFVEDVTVNIEKEEKSLDDEHNLASQVEAVPVPRIEESEDITWREFSEVTDRLMFCTYVLATFAVNAWLLASLHLN